MTDVEQPLPMMQVVPVDSAPGEGMRFRQRISTAVSIAAIAGVLIVLLALTIQPLLLIFMSILFAVGLRGLAKALRERTGLSIKKALGVVVAALIAVTVLAIVLLGRQIIGQVEELGEALPASLEALQNQLSQSGWGQGLLNLIPSADEIGGLVRSSFSQATGAFSNLFGWAANVLVVIFLMFMFALEPNIYIDNLIRLVPQARRPRIRQVVSSVGEILRKWLLARVMSMTFVGILTTVGLLIGGAPLALTMGLIAGVTSFIPTFGPVIAVVPAALLALLEGPGTALFVIALYIVVQQIDNFVLTPILDRVTVSLPGALTIVAQLLLGAVAGFMGLTLAAPLAATSTVLVRMLYVEDVLNDRQPAPEDADGR
jgi:predicted PurR-regulated permease PerM